MKRNILLVFIMLLVNSAIVRVCGQTITDSLIKEVIHESRAFGEEWENDKKNSYQYDIYGNEILNRLSIWNKDSSSWTISNEEFSEYDGDRNRTWFYLVNYFEYPEKQSDRKELREYSEGLVKYRNITIQDYNTSVPDSIRVYDVFYEYNENGDRTKFTVHYTANNEFRGGYGFRWHFNDDYCETAYVDFDIDVGGNELISDSVATSRDSWCNITQQSKYDNSFGYYDLFSDILFDYEYDTKGNILSFTEYQRTKSYEDWQKIITLNYTYNVSDLTTSIEEINFLSNRGKLQSLVYDYQDRMVLHSEEIKESPESDWILDSYFEWNYNESDQLEKVEFNLDWNPIAKIFNSRSITEHFFDSEGKNFRTISDRTFNGQRTTKEENRNFRCDGLEISENLITRNYISGGIVRTEDAIQTSYFKQAPCQLHETVSSEFVIYPNPTENYFRIYNEETFGDSRLKVIDSKGDLVKELTGKVDNYFSMDITALEPGLYIIQIETETGSSSQKFIKK